MSNMLVQLIITIVGSVIVSLATVIAVYATLRHDKRKEEARKRQLQREKIYYLQSLMQSVLKKTDTQIGHFRDFITRAKKSPLGDANVSTVPHNDLHRLVHELCREDYYHAYLGVFGSAKETAEEIKIAFSILDFLDAFLKQFDKHYRKVAKKVDAGSDECEKQIESALKKTLSANGNGLNRTEVAVFVKQQLVKLYKLKADRHGVEQLHNDFFQPLKMRLQTELASNTCADDLILDLESASVVFTAARNRGLDLVDQLDELIPRLEESLQTLKDKTERLMKWKNEYF